MLVVLPVGPPDRDQAVRWVNWVKELGGLGAHRLIVACARRVANPQELVPEGHELYIPHDEDERGWPMSPNHLFKRVLQHVTWTKDGEPFLWCEPDCVPTKKGWLDLLEGEYRACGKPFMGAQVLVANTPEHMSGNAIYGKNAMYLATNLVQADRAAFDVVGAEQIIGQAHWTKLIQHVWRTDEGRNFKFPDQASVDAMVSKEASLFHQNKDGSLIERLRERLPIEDKPAKQELKKFKNKKPSIDLFYTTYPKDKHWFSYSVRIAKRNLSGIRNIVAVVRQQHLQEFLDLNLDVVYKTVPDSWNSTRGYHWQQWIKMRAPEFTDADFIAHVDSDTYFKEPVNIYDFFSDTKPGWLYRKYEELRVPWKALTEKAIGHECEIEYMQSSPFIIGRNVYAKAKEILERAQNCTIEKYIYDSGATDWPPGFSEYNFLGNIANRFFKDDYFFVHATDKNVPIGFSKIHLCWSHSDFSKQVDILEGMLKDTVSQKPITTDRGIWILSNDTHISEWVVKYQKLDFDGHLLPHILPLINPGDSIIDVGAFIGDHTYAYALKTHGVDTGMVYAFEPNPDAFFCLEKNTETFSHVKRYNCGLGDCENTASLVKDSNAGASMLTSGGGVQIKMLDSIEIPRLNGIKVDAEGFELKVLKGAEKTLAKFKPWLVLEFNAGALRLNDTSADEIIKWLSDRGYRAFKEVGSGDLKDVFFRCD